MAMPEASMDEDNCSEFWEHKVRPPRKVLWVDPEPETPLVKAAAQDHFGSCVLTFDSPHVPRAGLRSMNIDQRSGRLKYAAGLRAMTLLCFCFKYPCLHQFRHSGKHRNDHGIPELLVCLHIRNRDLKC